MNNRHKEVDVVVLCGGLGKRLRPAVNDRPKSMAMVNGRPFLDFLIDKVIRYGFRKLILCTGYMGGIIEEYCSRKGLPLEIVCSKENKPLGTGGALRNASALIQSKTFMVLNGDTVSNLDLNKFLAFHKKKNAILSMALIKSNRTADFGSVRIDDSSRIVGYKEKINSDKKGLVNAGIYLMEKEIFLKMPRKRCFSLENDFFPNIIDARCFGFLSKKGFIIDIGTPQGYARVKNKLRKS